MATSPEPRKELESTYMVSDRSNEEEIARLQLQERLLTDSMGGVLTEQPAPERFRHILDVGCGPGGWLIETALAYPQFSLLVGIDISTKMLDIAREQARLAQVAERVEFHTMDALRMLEFPNASFDLINQRAGLSWLRKWEWTKLLQEYKRLLRTDGVIRITEVNGALESNSPALMRLWNLTAEAFYRAGISFSLTGDDLGDVLVSLLEQHGLKQVQMQTYLLEYRPGTPAGDLFVDNMKHLFRTIKPFLEKWLRLPDDYAEIYQQMARECTQAEFYAAAKLFTVWGAKAL